jgi:hypothetical protein
MSAHAEPGTKIGLHGVTGGAKQGALGLSHKVRRAETQEQAARRDYDAQQEKAYQNLPLVSVEKAHFVSDLTRMSISLELQEIRDEKNAR